MAEQRIVQTAFWYDDYVSGLGKMERYFFLYLLTNPHTNISGVYEIGMKYMRLETDFTQEEILAMFAKFENDWRARYEKWWVAMKNWRKHQKHGSFTIQKGIDKYMAKAPEWCRKYVSEKGYAYPLAPESESQSELELESELEITSEDVTADSPPADSPKGEERGTENLEVTAMLERLRKLLSLQDFKEDARKQRVRGKNLVDLRAKIGENEFARRWRALVDDPFKLKRCNSLDYVYGELKAHVDPGVKKADTDKKRQSAEAAAAAEDAKRKAAEREENERLDALLDSWDEKTRTDIMERAEKSLAEQWITKESDVEKKRKVFVPMLIWKIRKLTAEHAKALELP